MEIGQQPMMQSQENKILNKSSYTIHKKIYFSSVDKFGKFQTKLKTNKIKNSLFIIDEASMISDSTNSSDLFTRKSLLTDIFKYVNFNNNSKILDIGTGGGFPGIPLAIMFPEVQFHLTDSIGKKIKVVNSIVNDLNLTNAHGQQIRSEKLSLNYDYIVNRAVSNMSNLVNLVGDKISKENNHKLKNGIISLKGGDLNDELKPFKNIEVFNINQFFNESFFETKKVVYLPIPYKGKDSL